MSKVVALIVSEEEREDISKLEYYAGFLPDWLRAFTPSEYRQAEGLLVEDFAATAAAREHPEYQGIVEAIYGSMIKTNGGGRLTKSWDRA